MPPKKNPLKLNKLQLRTLVLAQLLAADPGIALVNEDTGDVSIMQIPHAHGDHVHIGQFTVAAREISGLSNPAVWTALERKDLARSGAVAGAVATLTAYGMSYDTGLGDRFTSPSDH